MAWRNRTLQAHGLPSQFEPKLLSPIPEAEIAAQ
jgi:hypothetical protein